MKHTRKKLTNNRPKQQQAKKEKNVETKENLQSMLEEYKKTNKRSREIIERLTDILSRNSAQKMTQQKLTRLKNKLALAQEENTFSQVAIDQIAFRLTQIT